jgi:hypothetical protein
MQLGESKEYLQCSCWRCSNCSCDTQASQPLQFAKFHLACLEFNSGPPYCNYGSYNYRVYPMHNVRLQSPSFTKYVSASPKSLIGFLNMLAFIIHASHNWTTARTGSAGPRTLSVPLFAILSDVSHWKRGLDS